MSKKSKIINLEIVSLWLNTGKHELKKTLVASYIENNDYRLAGGGPPASLKYGGNNKNMFI